MNKKKTPAEIVSKIVALLGDMEQKVGKVEELLRQLETTATTQRLADEIAAIDRQLEHALKATIQAKF